MADFNGTVNFDSSDPRALIEMGGYRYPILEKMANGRPFQILKVNLPATPEEHAAVEELVFDPETLYSYVEDGRLTVVRIIGKTADEATMANHGWQILTSAKAGANKVPKRLKTLNRPFRLKCELGRPLNIMLVDDDAYSNEDLRLFSEADVEKLLDGAFAINRRLVDACIENVEFPRNSSEVEGEVSVGVDYFRSEQFLKQAARTHSYNGRIFGPFNFMGIADDHPDHQIKGLLKGEIFAREMPDEYADVDIICTRSAIKPELRNDEETWILLEPQRPKFENIVTDIQTMVNNQVLFPIGHLREWIGMYFDLHFDRLTKNQIMESFYDMSAPVFHSDNKVWGGRDIQTLTRWNIRSWLLRGRDIRESQWLFRHLADGIAQTIRLKDNKTMRFPVPCTVRCQVISNSLAAMAGVAIGVERGTIRWAKEIECLVVNDLDWIEMYESHGGCDLDDFFNAFYRMIDGERWVVVTRSPNDFGEYSKFRYVEGDWYPTFTKVDGEVLAFPEITGKFWPKRLSEVIRDGEITYRGLPSEHESNVSEPHAYGPYDVLEAIEDNEANGVAVGANVNARVLWSLVMKTHRRNQLTTMEKCIDAGTQGGSGADVLAVTEEAAQIVEQVIASGRKIDEYYWKSRFEASNPRAQVELTNTTLLTRADAERHWAVREFKADVRDWSNLYIRTCDPVVAALGQRYLASAQKMIINTRLDMYMAQPDGEQTLEPGEWNNVHGRVIEHLENTEDIQDRHDYVLALWAASFVTPTKKTKRISDQIVMNPDVFERFLIPAMEFYGLCYGLRLNEDNKIERFRNSSWDLPCTRCGAVGTTSDPVILQRYHIHGGVCVACR